MTLIRIDRNPSRQQLHLFGALWLAFFVVLGGITYAATGNLLASGIVWALAVAVPIIGRFTPRLMRLIYLGMAYAALPVGLVVSYALLCVVYYLVLTPIGLAMRLLGRDPMHRRFDRAAESYWVKRAPSNDLQNYFRQY